VTSIEPHPIVRRLWDIRRGAKLSRRKVAARTGIAVSTVVSWECKGVNPGLAQLVWWAEALGYELVLQPKERS
jgi:Predicted transcriptional regulators